MRFVLSIESGNDLLTGDNAEFELAGILRNLADRISERSGILRDANGNTVGIWDWSHAEGADVQEMREAVAAVNAGALGDSNDDEIQSLQLALEHALKRWPEVVGQSALN